MKKSFLSFFIFFFIFCGGCAKLAHLPELLTLKGFSQDRDQQDWYIEKQDENFEKLLTAVKNNALEKFSSRRRFLNAFGEPILSVQVLQEDGKTVEKWLYRYATRPFDSPKVYVYFDRKGKLLEWQYLPNKKGVNNESVL